MLKTEPSLSIYCDSEDGFDPVENLERTVTIGDSIDSEFSFIGHDIDILPIKEEEDDDGEKRASFRVSDDGEEGEKGASFRVSDYRNGERVERSPSPPMHLATGLGIDKFDLYEFDSISFDLPSFDDENCDEYYKRMLEDYPMHPLLHKNYAKFLEYKGDLNGAEEYYHKCIIVEPSDGVALANYGRLVMKLHKDEAKALSYFERAVHASPEDSHVLASYASFLWEINAEDDDDDYFGNRAHIEKKKPEASGKRSSSISETEDGETLCRYAKAFWSIKGDNEKALFYFEKAIEASSNDCMILGEYARFLWETEE